MTKSTKTRIKAATTATPQSLEETQGWIKQLGDTQRELARESAAMNDEIAVITDRHTPAINALKDKMKELQKGIQAWCEANKTTLITGKSKTVNMTTGEVMWRLRPPSVSVRGVSAVLEALDTLGLRRFIRTKEEINKDALLNEPDIAATVAGITIKKDVEDFVIKPFEQQSGE